MEGKRSTFFLLPSFLLGIEYHKGTTDALSPTMKSMDVLRSLHDAGDMTEKRPAGMVRVYGARVGQESSWQLLFELRETQLQTGLILNKIHFS